MAATDRVALRSFATLQADRDWAAWRALTHGAPPFLAPEFFRLIAPLTSGEPLVAEAWHDGALVGVLPVALDGHTLSGMVCDHTPGFDYRGSAEGIDAIWRALVTDPRWDVLQLSNLPAGSPLITRLHRVAERDRARVVIKPGSRHLFLDLRGFEAGLSSKFVANLRRCGRKLGGIELERIASPTRSDFQAALAIEAMAWKGAAGESIASDARVTHLYDALTRTFGRRGQASLAFLRARGERIAQLLTVEDGHTLYALKIGYDPRHADASPGHLMVWSVAQDAERRGLAIFDFLGHDDTWKHKWTERFEQRMSVLVYRHTPRGMAIRALREVIKPRVAPRIAAALQRGCQRTDLLGDHTVLAQARDRLQSGLGIRSGIKRAFGKAPKARPRLGAPSRFPEGAWVRVLDEPALRATLDGRSSLRGLKLVPAQLATAGRVYRVQKHIRRMMDDHGMMRPIARTVLLEGVTCAGEGPEPAGCGRHCPLMYRDEWLVDTDAPTAVSRTSTPQGTRHARVRDIDEIRATLDLHGRRDGLTFMPEMEKHTSQRFRVVSRLPQVYELDRWLAPRGATYILEGLHCTGEALGERGPCERQCALLWHEDWLLLDPE